jgi:uncharacterized membrane protein YdbT with pleckstrin-like domain
MFLLDPNVDKTILTSAGERKVAEEGKHWVVCVWPGLRVLIGLLMIVGALHYDGAIFWVLLILSVAVICQALWRLVEERRDRFVITNQRIFRVWGMLFTHRASVPLLRILDITVDHPLAGKIFNYGHFVFESAAQVQGLKNIRFVPDIDQLEGVLRMVMGGQTPEPPPIDDGT